MTLGRSPSSARQLRTRLSGLPGAERAKASSRPYCLEPGLLRASKSRFFRRHGGACRQVPRRVVKNAPRPPLILRSQKTPCLDGQPYLPLRSRMAPLWAPPQFWISPSSLKTLNLALRSFLASPISSASAFLAVPFLAL